MLTFMMHDQDGVLSFEELQALILKNKQQYPQLLIYAAKMEVWRGAYLIESEAYSPH